MAFCPKCQSTDYREHKSWDVKPKGAKKEIVRVTVFSCRSCGNKFRVASKFAPNHSANGYHGSHRPGVASTQKLGAVNDHLETPQQTAAPISSEVSPTIVQIPAATTSMPIHESLIQRLLTRLHGFF